MNWTRIKDQNLLNEMIFLKAVKLKVHVFNADYKHMFENSEINIQKLETIFTTDFPSNLGSNFNRFETYFSTIFNLSNAFSTKVSSSQV